MLILWILISSLVATEKVERHDIDGLLLARILSKENEQLSVDQKLRLSAQVATKYRYPHLSSEHSLLFSIPARWITPKP